MDKNGEKKKKALDLAVSQIEKQFGKGSIMKLDGSVNLEVECLPTGVITLDRALGAGGVPRGRIVELFGKESSGKTSLAQSIIAETQKTGGITAFIDAEHAFDPSYAKVIGVDVNNLLVSQPDTGEQALEITETLVRSNAVDLIVVDSVAALTPRSEIEGEMGDSQVGVQARLMSQALRKLTAVSSKSKTCIIFINQIREKIGVMFGNPETTPGGRALKFYSSVRIELKKPKTLVHQNNIIGAQVRAKIVKNKVAPPFKETMFEITHTEGVSKVGNLVDAALELGIISRAGSWFSYKDKKLAQGKEAVKKTLQDDSKLLQQIKKETEEKIYPKKEEVTSGKK